MGVRGVLDEENFREWVSQLVFLTSVNIEMWSIAAFCICLKNDLLRLQSHLALERRIHHTWGRTH
jgi:DNA polymerase III delta subunit